MTAVNFQDIGKNWSAESLLYKNATVQNYLMDFTDLAPMSSKGRSTICSSSCFLLSSFQIKIHMRETGPEIWCNLPKMAQTVLSALQVQIQFLTQVTYFGINIHEPASNKNPKYL